ncbi:integrase core domain-containing protein, partial [Burkholderia mallei]|uniref:integrase core domain-containing protein n=1 Tax=Burkholderia mallei TaxID=13373 RepID=UPI0039913477
FTTLAHARAVIAAWRQDYNEQRPHSALNYLAPSEFCGETSGNRGRSCRFPGVGLKGLLLEAHWPYRRGQVNSLWARVKCNRNATEIFR